MTPLDGPHVKSERLGPSFPLVRVGGTPEQRGLAYGRLARTRIHKTLRAYSELFRHYAGLEWPAITAYARRYLPIVNDHDHSLVEEMRGIARGAGVEPDDVLAINVRTEIMYGLGEMRAAECTAFAALPQATLHGHTLVGQNWDWHPSASECCVVLAIDNSDDDRSDDSGPERAYGRHSPSILTVVEAGLLAKAGMNGYGVAVATNALVSDLDQGEPGIPYHVMLRRILSSHSFDDAVASVHDAQRASSANYLIASRNGTALNLETAPGGPARVFTIEPSHGVVGHANCFVARGVSVGDVTALRRPLGKTRQRTIDGELSRQTGAITVESMQAVLRDHTHHPQAMCRHPLEEVPPLDRSATVASMIMDLDDGVLWVASGQPCCHPYRRFSARETWSQRAVA